jgi:hypothetical protein
MTADSLAADLLCAVILILPLIVSGFFHMWVVTRNHLAALAVPIHRVAFGSNKTWRGFAVMPLATVPGPPTWR